MFYKKKKKKNVKIVIHLKNSLYSLTKLSKNKMSYNIYIDGQKNVVTSINIQLQIQRIYIVCV